MPQNTDSQVQDRRTEAPAVSNSRKRRESDISLLDVLIVLAERKGTVLGITLAFAIGSAAVSLVLPKTYTSSVTLLPPQQNSSSLGSALTAQLGSLSGAAGLAGGGGGLSLKNPNDLVVAMLKSRTVEDAMVQQFGLLQEYHERLVSQAAKAFEHHVSVDGNTKDGLIHIAVDDRNPQRAAELANGYVEQLRKLSGASRHHRSRATPSLL